MLVRFGLGVLVAGAVALPALAEQMNADVARRFVSGKTFAFNCFDGTKGTGRILDDGSAHGSVQFSGSSAVRNLQLPTNTLQVRGQAICAAIKGMPFEPCFDLQKNSGTSFRGSVSGFGFAYCDFRRQGNARVQMTQAISRPRSLRAPEQQQQAQSADTSRGEAAQTIQVRTEPVLELRRSTAE